MPVDPHRGRLFLSLCLLLAFFADPLIEISSARYFYLSRAIVEEGKFEVDAFAHPSRGDLATRNGRLYSGVLPGIGLMLTPHAALAAALRELVPLRPNLLMQLFAILFFNVPAAAFATILCAATLEECGLSRRRARWVAAATLLGTPLWFFTSKLSDYPIATLLAVILLRCVIHDRRAASRAAAESGSANNANIRPPSCGRAARALLAGGVLGLLYIVNDLAFLLGLVFVALAMPRSAASLPARIKHGIIVAAGFLPCAIMRAVYMKACFGSPFENPYHFSASGITVFEALPGGFIARILAMLAEAPAAWWGITFGTAGLFVFAPVFWLLVPALRRPKTLVTPPLPLRALFVPFLLNTFLHVTLVGGLWSGGASWGPRYMLFTTAFALFGLAFFAISDRAWTIAASLSIAVTWIGVQYGYATSLLHEIGLFMLGGPTSPLFRYLWMHWTIPSTPARVALVMEETPRSGAFYAYTHPSPFAGYALLATVLLLLWLPEIRKLARTPVT
jgi:hypothetical protein